MLQPVSVGLKFGFLIILYLFLLWVATSSFLDLRRGSRQGVGEGAGSDETGVHTAAGAVAAEFEPRLVVEEAPGHQSGVAYDLRGGATLGRGEVEIQLHDQFASSRHAKISRQGQTLVIEDLGSTNGTYLNDEQLSGPRPLHDGDVIRIGDSEFTYLQ